MKKYIIITADTNDADYITSKNEISDELLKELEPVFKVLKDRKKLSREKNDWSLRRNWESGERYNNLSPQNSYVNDKLLTEEQIDLFDEFVPYGEYGIHTIESIEILEVINEETLL